MVSLNGSTMGTTYHIKYIPVSETASQDDIQKLVDRLLSDLESSMSTYKSDSEISRFNFDTQKTAFTFGYDAKKVIKQALVIGEQSKGALDITVAPLVELWGFGKNKSSEVPKAQEIKLAKTKTGLQHLKFIGSSLTVTNPLVQVDLSSIAKGYAVDEVAALLSAWGLDNFMVEIGGEITVKGTKLGTAPWVLGIEKPSTGDRAVQISFPASNMSLATSGDYRNFFEKDGLRYSHIIDPTTAKPVTHNLASVTVIHESCMVADAWATAFLVMGTKKALEIAKEQGLAVYLIYKEGDHFETAMTDQFTKATSPTKK
ncbi:MAG: FAD:protein FMN transferase [SAR324 cluster bacterium]|nr:FAD:protein FMN transferase [SAR324 cluster bacterium]